MLDMDTEMRKGEKVESAEMHLQRKSKVCEEGGGTVDAAADRVE